MFQKMSEQKYPLTQKHQDAAESDQGEGCNVNLAELFTIVTKIGPTHYGWMAKVNLCGALAD